MPPLSPPAKAAGVGEKWEKLSPRGKTGFAAALIVLAALAAYHNSFSGPFVMDDRVTVIDNPSIRHLWPLGPVIFPATSFNTNGGRSFLNLTFAINYAIGGLDVRGYHVVNLLVHMLAGLTLFGVVRRTLLRGQASYRDIARRDITIRGLTPLLTPSERIGDNSLHLAFIVAVLWTVHPLNTEAVTYVYERAESMMALFYLLTLYCFIRYADEKAESGKRKAETFKRSGFSLSAFRFPLLCVAACVFGAATKEVMVTAPVMVFLYDRTFVSGTFRAAWRRHWGLYVALLCTWLQIAAELRGKKDYSVGYGGGATWWGYALTECQAVVHYLRLVFWPNPLVYDFGLTVLPGGFLPVAPYALLLLALIGLTVLGLINRPVLGFIGCWFFVILAPTSSVVPIAGQPVGEHHMYLPLMGIIALTVAGIYTWLGRRSLILFGVLALALGWRTVVRNDDYRTAVSFYGATVRERPGNFFARYNLAKALEEAGSIPEAIEQYQETVRLEPDEVRPHIGLGNVLSDAGRLDEAANQYETAIRLDPNTADAYLGLGNLLFRAGQPDAAIEQYKSALHIDPGFAAVYVNLGIAQSQLRDFADALGSYKQAIHFGADSAEIRNNLGTALAEVGRLEEAADQYREALRLDPDNVGAQRNYKVVLEKLGQTDGPAGGQ